MISLASCTYRKLSVAFACWYSEDHTISMLKRQCNGYGKCASRSGLHGYNVRQTRLCALFSSRREIGACDDAAMTGVSLSHSHITMQGESLTVDGQDETTGTRLHPRAHSDTLHTTLLSKDTTDSILQSSLCSSLVLDTVSFSAKPG
jgi:hypothetical protein